MNIGLTGGLLGNTLGSAQAGTEAEIWDGIAGLRLRQELTDKWFCRVYGDVGTGMSDLTWQVLGDIGYQFTDTFSLSTGYRYVHFDLSSGNNDIGLTGSGVQLTLDWKF